MLHLAAPTDPRWLPQVLEHLDEVLLDHAHCEKKAASTAVNLIFRWQDRAELMRPLSEVAREELDHFERMLALLSERGVDFRRQRPSPYGARLQEAVRRGEDESYLDTLLVCALIEARSCERMKILSEELPDEALKAFYKDLLASEARHHHLYVDLALKSFDRDVVFGRLAELARIEAEILAQSGPDVRMHS
jgi:tRNA-(ms[2]io[6]A)-hydroxylase